MLMQLRKGCGSNWDADTPVHRMQLQLRAGWSYSCARDADAIARRMLMQTKNEQTRHQTSKQANERTNKQTNTQTVKQSNTPASKQTNQQTNTHTHKQTIT